MDPKPLCLDPDLRCLKDAGFRAGRYYCTAPKGHDGRCRRFLPDYLVTIDSSAAPPSGTVAHIR